MNVIKKTINLFFNFLVAAAFEHSKKCKIFLHSHILIESIILEADSSQLPYLINIFDSIITKYFYLSTCGYLHSSHHSNRGALPCSIMPKQHKYLVCDERE
jgi:hypothetical protein